MKRLKAFSLVELITSLLISGLLIGFSLWIFLTLRKSYVNNARENTLNNEAMLFYNTFSRDADRAEYISWQYNKAVLSSPGKDLTYNFEENIILRYSNYTTDTFRLKTKNLEFTPLKSNDNYIQTISLTIELKKGLNQPISFYKCYPNKFLYHKNLSVQ